MLGEDGVVGCCVRFLTDVFESAGLGADEGGHSALTLTLGLGFEMFKDCARFGYCGWGGVDAEPGCEFGAGHGGAIALQVRILCVCLFTLVLSLDNSQCCF